MEPSGLLQLIFIGSSVTQYFTILVLLITFLRMPDIMRGPKSHDIEHHLLQDIVAHGNPAGYDVIGRFRRFFFIISSYCSALQVKVR